MLILDQMPPVNPVPGINMQVLAAYLQGLATNENRPGLERDSLSSAATGLSQLAQSQGENGVLRKLLREAADLIEHWVDDLGFDFEEIEDKVPLLNQIRRALGEVTQ